MGDDPEATPCPYKLLIGSEKGSKIKDVSSDEEQRQIFFTKKPSDLSQIKTSYDKKVKLSMLHLVIDL